MSDAFDRTPDPDPELGDDGLQDIVRRVFDDAEIDWSETQASARTIGDLRVMRNLYGLWKIYEFNRILMEGDDPTDLLGPSR